MIRVNDDFVKPILLDKLRGTSIREDHDKEVEEYFKEIHHNWAAVSGEGILCISFYGSYAIANYAWRENKRSVHKEMVEFAKALYKCYTIINNIPILYTGKVNFYPNHSREIGKNSWILEMKV